MMKPNYKWDFPLSNYTSYTSKRQDDVLDSLRVIRKERDNDKTYKKMKERATQKYGHMRSSLGFAGAAMLGDTADGFSTGFHTKPSNFIMSKEKEAQSMATTIYDDTGRGM